MQSGLVPIWKHQRREFEPLRIGGFQYLSDLPSREASFSIQKTLFLGFPEVLTGGVDAHYNAIGWCISRKAVIINRDVFSAGGQQRIGVVGCRTPVLLPGVISKAMTALSRPCPVSFEDLSEIYGSNVRSFAEATAVFRRRLESLVGIDPIIELITPHLTSTSRQAARNALVETIFRSVERDGFAR